MRWFLVCLVLTGCADLTAPVPQPQALVYCGYDTCETETPPDDPSPPPVILHVWACNFLPDSLVVHAYGEHGTALFSSLHVALDPGAVIINHTVNSPLVTLTFRFSFVSSRIVWTVTAWQDNLLAATKSLVWTQ